MRGQDGHNCLLHRLWHNGRSNYGGLAKNPEAKHFELCGYNRSQDKMKFLEKAGVRALNSIDEAAEIADILILGVKPHQVLMVIGRSW